MAYSASAGAVLVARSVADRIVSFLSIADACAFVVNLTSGGGGEGHGFSVDQVKLGKVNRDGNGCRNTGSCDGKCLHAPENAPERKCCGCCSRSPPEKAQRGAESGGGLLQGMAWLAMQPPMFALSMLGDALRMVSERVPLMELIKWAASSAAAISSTVVHFTISVPASWAGSVVANAVGMVMALLNFAAEIWSELRHLSLHDLVCLLVCLAKGESLPTHLVDLEGHGSTGDRASACSDAPLYFSGDKPSAASSHTATWGSAVTSAMGEFRASSHLRRLTRANRTSDLVSYVERGGRAQAAKGHRAERVRRMLRYDVSLRPFSATVRVRESGQGEERSGVDDEGDLELQTPGSVSNLPIHTPHSFPPSPTERRYAMSQTLDFSDDVVFLARAHLRLNEHLKCEDATTRLTADFLKRQSRLAVLSSHGAAEGIILSCGNHCAVKVGPALYSSVRAMVPILRNRHIFFQFSIMAQEAAVASLSLGLSTAEMPLNTLVGAWQHSVGICSTGQVLLSSRWYGCAGQSSFGVGSTVGVLVYLDDTSAYQSWDGMLVTATCTFSVDGEPVTLGMSPKVNPGGASRTSSTAASMEIGCPLALPVDGDLYPTITLHSPAVQVLCRFCAADLVIPNAAGRSSIGAPPGVPVYALDGSLVFGVDDGAEIG